METSIRPDVTSMNHALTIHYSAHSTCHNKEFHGQFDCCTDTIVAQLVCREKNIWESIQFKRFLAVCRSVLTTYLSKSEPNT